MGELVSIMNNFNLYLTISQYHSIQGRCKKRKWKNILSCNRCIGKNPIFSFFFNYEFNIHIIFILISFPGLDGTHISLCLIWKFPFLGDMISTLLPLIFLISSLSLQFIIVNILIHLLLLMLFMFLIFTCYQLFF